MHKLNFLDVDLKMSFFFFFKCRFIANKSFLKVYVIKCIIKHAQTRQLKQLTVERCLMLLSFVHVLICSCVSDDVLLVCAGIS